MAMTKNRCAKSHFDVNFQEHSDRRAAARWAWKCLENLAWVFCEYHCKGFSCSEFRGRVELSLFQLRTASKRKREKRWNDVQRDIHEALAHLHELNTLIGACPACAIVEAFSSFPLIAEYSPALPATTVVRHVIPYPGGKDLDGDQIMSVPCVIIRPDSTVFGEETEARLRELALLTLDVSDLPAIPLNEYDEIKKKLIPGQEVVKRLDELRRKRNTGLVKAEATGNRATRKAAKKKPKKRATRTATIDGLKQALREHLRAARDHAYKSRDRGISPLLLLRPTQKQLAAQLNVSISSISRAINDPLDREIGILWETANDLQQVMRFKG